MAGLLMKHPYEHQSVGHADDTKPVESCLPRPSGGHERTEAAERLAAVETRHMQSYGQRPPFAGEIVGYQRQRRGDIERLAYTHDAAKPHELMEIGAVAHAIGHAAPHTQRAHDEPLAAHTVGHSAREGACYTIYPKENSHQRTKHLGFLKRRNIGGNVLLHGRQHLPVHIIKQCHYPQQPYDHPGIIALLCAARRNACLTCLHGV